jgi:hypothetical protein
MGAAELVEHLSAAALDLARQSGTHAFRNTRFF